MRDGGDLKDGGKWLDCGYTWEVELTALLIVGVWGRGGNPGNIKFPFLRLGLLRMERGGPFVIGSIYKMHTCCN